MKVTLLQRDTYWCEPEKNRREAERMISDSSGSDLYVMTEMFTTGFCMTPADIAEISDSSATLDWMRRVAVERRCALAGSIAIEEGGRYYNRFYFVFPNGTEQHYDKHHLFTYAREQEAYAPGTGRVVVTYQGVRILLQICYDLRFPVWSRNHDDYDLILYVASWPASRISVWDTLLRARALENQCYVAGVNRIGKDPFCSYNGHSVAINAYGKDLVAGGEKKTAESFHIDLESLQAFRRKFPVLEDRDRFMIV